MPQYWWLLLIAILVFPAVYILQGYKRKLRNKYVIPFKNTKKGLIFFFTYSILVWTAITIYTFRDYEFSFLKVSIFIIIWIALLVYYYSKFKGLKKKII